MTYVIHLSKMQLKFNINVLECHHSLTIFSKYLYWTIELVQGKGALVNYYSEIKDEEYEQVKDADGYEDVKEVDEYKVMDGGETFVNPGVQKEQQMPFDWENEVHVRTSDGGGSSQTSQSYVNEDEDPSLDVHWPLTKNPAYGLPPVGILQSGGKCEVRTSDGEGSSQTSQSYVNEDEDPSLDVHWHWTKNPAYGLPPVGILQSDHVDDNGTQQ